jgi:alpha-1,6-mannosyltransferase
MYKKRALILFLLLWIFLQGICIALWKLNNWNDHLLYFLGLYLLFFVIYCIAVYLTRRQIFDLLPNIGLWIIVSSLLLRATILFCTPSLSEDFYRYVWDGRTQGSGLSPYTYPPEASELQFLRNADYEKINHKDVKTPYPPFAENMFHLLVRISTHHEVFQFGIVLFDVLLILVLALLLRKESLPASMLLIYAWHPLPIVEFAGNAHIDIVAMSLLFVAYFAVTSSRVFLAGILLAAAALTKYIPLLTLPWFVQKGRWRVLLSFGISCFLIALPFYLKEPNMFGGLFLFYKKWRFNDSLFGILYDWLGGAEPARIWGGFFTALIVIFCISARYSLYRSFLYAYGTMILFSPVVHPWYVCWLIPCLAFYPSKPWIFFSGWIAVSYLIRFLFPTGEWHEPLWLKLLVYLPFYLLLLLQAFQKNAPEQAAVIKE